MRTVPTPGTDPSSWISAGSASGTQPYSCGLHRSDRAIEHQPMLADVDPYTYGLDPVSVARCLEQRVMRISVKALIAVHLYGYQ